MAREKEGKEKEKGKEMRQQDGADTEEARNRGTEDDGCCGSRVTGAEGSHADGRRQGSWMLGY